MEFDYDSLESVELFVEAKKITETLRKRREYSEFSLEQQDQLEILSSLFNLDDQERKYFFEIGVSKCGSFYIEWHTPTGSKYQGYRLTESNEVIPDETLLARAPVRWLENLLLGVYNLNKECYD